MNMVLNLSVMVMKQNEVIEQFYNSKPVWENYDAFLKSVREKRED